MADAVSALQVVVEGKDETTKVLKGIESSIIRFVGAVSASLAVVSVAVFPVKAAATFQKELLNVGKTTEFTDAQLTTLGAGLKTLSYQLNISADDLAKIAAAGGQMGLGREGVSGLLIFTEAASRMASVLDITAEDSGNAIARLTNIFKISISEAERISSVLNEISNNSTAKGADLIDMVQRIGTAGGTLTFTQSAALAATGRDLGLTVETVGTSFNKVFLSMQTKAAAIAPMLGMSVEKFVALVKTDGIAALKLYINAINQMGDAQQAAFVQSTIGGGRIFALMTSLAKDGASGFAVMNRNLGSSTKGYASGTSALKEQERVMSGLIAQGVALQNVFIGIAESVGSRALPYLTRLTKQMQEWAKDPEILDFFNRVATYIGSFADAVIGAIKTVSGLTGVLGPLLRAFQIFLGIKIIGGLIGIASSLIAQGRAVVSTTKAWWGLATANQAAIRATADAARSLQAGNATAVAAGKTPKSLSTFGQVGSFLNTALAPKFALENQLTAKMAEMNNADKLLTQRTQQRLAVLGSIRTEMSQITASYKTQARAAYDAVIAAGGTKKDAKAASTASKQASNLRMLNLSVADSNLSKAYDDAIKRRQDNLVALSRQAKATNTSLQNMGTIGPIFSAMGTGIQRAATGLGTLAMRFVAVGGTIAAVIGLSAYFLDMFGLLDPVVSTLKEIVGITDKAKVEQRRAAAERAASIAAERDDADELAKVYDDQKKAKDEAAKAGKGTATAKAPTELAAEVRQLQILNGKYASLAFQAADIADSTALIASRWGTVSKALEEAKRKYDDLVAQKKRKDLLDLTASPLKKEAIDKENIIADKDIATAKARVDDLAESIDLLGKARVKFQNDAVQNSADSLTLANEAMKQAERIAPLFDAGGFAALKAFSKVLEGQKKLTAAQKAMEEAGKVGAAPEAKESDRAAYLIAAERVRGLEIELKVLQSTYDDVRTSSANASEFMATAFPDAAKTTVEKVQALIRILGGLSSGTSSAIEEKKKSIDAELADIAKVQAEIDKRTVKRIVDTHSSIPFMETYKLVTGKGDAELAAIKQEAAESNAALDVRRQKLAAIQNQLKLETAEAAKLQSLYKNVNPRDSGQSKVAYFAQTAALKQLNTLQIAAQNKVREGANFNAEQIKRLYEESKSALSSTVADAKHELQDLGNYFASRQSTLKLATFDYNQAQGNEQYRKFQTSIIEDQRKFLEAQGLSSDEIALQIGLLQEANNQMDKMRQAGQDEMRQRMIINDIQNSMKSEQASIQEASSKAKAYADLAVSMRDAGNEAGADSYTQKAAVEAEKARLSVETLTEKLKEFKSEAAKPVTGAAGPMLLVSDAEVSATVEAALKAKVEARQADTAAMEQANTVAAKWAVDQDAALTNLTSKAAEYQKQLSDVISTVPGLAAAQDALAATVISNTAGVKDVADSLKSIAITDFRGLDQFQTISAQSDKIRSMSEDMKGVALTYAESVVPIGETFANVAKAVTDNLELSGSKVQGVLQSALTTGALTAPIHFPDAVAVLQNELETGNITVPIKFAAGGGGNIQKNAEGGPIRGPGTGTSDSILSWVSNGEYINDAQTTSFFGENFFQTLKSIARGGRLALSGFSTKVSGGLSLPAFAGGGYIGAAALGAGSGIADAFSGSKDTVIGRIAVDMNIGGEKVSLLGERGQVDALVKALHKMNRG